MTDDGDHMSDIENMGPGDVPEPGPDEPELVEEGSGEEDAEAPGGEPEEDHARKRAARGTVSKAIGYAVELGSILGGQGGEIVGAEREVAAAETEELIDRVDGEG